MTLAAMPASEATAPQSPGDEALKRAIARAVWTDLLMPPDRTVTIAVTDGRVELGPDPEVPAH